MTFFLFDPKNIIKNRGRYTWKKNEIPLIKQIAKIKTFHSHIKLKDKEMIESAKKNGALDLGFYLPIDGEEIYKKANKNGIEVILEEVFIDNN